MEKEEDDSHADDTQTIRQEREKFIYHINEIENISCHYNIEDMGNESSEQEYLMYIEDHCRELRELIDKLYYTKLYIIKNDQVNKIGFYRDKLESEMVKGLNKFFSNPH
jgi:hypothetical protein